MTIALIIALILSAIFFASIGNFQAVGAYICAIIGWLLVYKYQSHEDDD